MSQEKSETENVKGLGAHVPFASCFATDNVLFAFFQFRGWALVPARILVRVILVQVRH